MSEEGEKEIIELLKNISQQLHTLALVTQTAGYRASGHFGGVGLPMITIQSGPTLPPGPRGTVS